MKSNSIHIITWPTMLIIVLVAVFAACTDMHEYKKYVEDGERIYTGKVDSLQVRPGESRVMVEGLFIADPKITETRIYWNIRSDSVVVPVERTGGIDTLRTIIEDLEEGNYNFEVVTYDRAGNSSLPVYGNSEVFGDRYKSSLLNRPIILNELYTGDLTTTIRFGSMDLASGVFATEIRYIDSDDREQTLHIPIDRDELLIEGYKLGTEFEYRTLFLPNPASIDTFSTGYETASPKLVYLKNTGNPFERASWDGQRWGILADWITTEDVKNAGGYGGYELRGGTGMLSLEGGWGLPGVPNGKIYQVVTLPAGSYTFEALGIETGASGTKYLVVSRGDMLPDADKVPDEAIVYAELSDTGGTSAIHFELTGNTEVAIGFVGNMPDTGSWFKVREVTFTQNN